MTAVAVLTRYDDTVRARAVRAPRAVRAVRRAVDAARALTAAAVEAAGNPHPGTAVGLLFRALLGHGPAGLGGAGEAVGVERFGAGEPYRRLYEQPGLAPERVAAAARSGLARTRRGGRR